jgi:AraC family transcriptional regulator, positive regulator of tynA and feaB
VKTIFSTADVHPRDSYDYWHEVLCKKVILHDCTPESRQTFRGELKAGAVADITLVSYENTPMYCRATRRHVGHANPEELWVVRQQRAGVTLLEQAGHELLLEAGDITLFDPRRPMAAKYFKGSMPLILKFPRRALEARIGKTQQMIAVPIKPTEPEQALASTFLEMLPTHTDALAPSTADLVRDQALDLIAVSLAKAMDEGIARVSSARALVLVNVRAAIESRLTDPALDPATVAAAAGVSVRYANAVLSEVGTSIGQLIRTRRLERCRRALQDPSQATRRISEIAYGWGFSDMTHFGRSFREAFGSLPSEYRRLAKST